VGLERKSAAMKTMFVRSVVVALGLQAAVVAQTAWVQVGSGGPQAGGTFAMANDSSRQRVVMAGGVKVWEWDGISWLDRSPPPGPFYYGVASSAMAYDSLRQRTVSFGGSDGFGPTGTWEWDGANWFSASAAVNPPYRMEHAMAYDSARQRVVLFGGSRYSVVIPLLGDTWEYDGTNWMQIPSASGPSPRFGHAMAYDSARQRIVLFGGFNGSSLSADTWEWNGSFWAAVFTPSFPLARWRHALAYDTSAQRVMLFGGTSSFGATPTVLADTWEFDGATWVNLSLAGSPPARRSHVMAYDEARQRVVVFGGRDSGGNSLADTWIMRTVPLTASATTFGAGCGQPPLGLVPDSAGRPVIGQIGSATVVDAPTSATFVAMGSSNQTYGPFALPVTLAGIGMIGCDLYQSSEVLGLSTTPMSPTTRSFSLAIPNTQSLIGIHVYLQAYAFAPGANPLSVIISNAIDWHLGHV
jgi:hypothetical protein